MRTAPMSEISIPVETPCADCGEQIGVSPWKQVEGRVYHKTCTPRAFIETPRPQGAPAGKRAEEAARRVLNPRQETLDER
jgi:hypothetical protein